MSISSRFALLALVVSSLGVSACGREEVQGTAGQPSGPGAGERARPTPACEHAISDTDAGTSLNTKKLRLRFVQPVAVSKSMVGPYTKLSYAVYSGGELYQGVRKTDAYFRKTGQPFCAIGFRADKFKNTDVTTAEAQPFLPIAEGTDLYVVVKQAGGANATFRRDGSRYDVYFRKSAGVASPSTSKGALADVVCYYPAAPGQEMARRDPSEENSLHIAALLRAALPAGSVEVTGCD